VRCRSGWGKRREFNPKACYTKYVNRGKKDGGSSFGPTEEKFRRGLGRGRVVKKFKNDSI